MSVQILNHQACFKNQKILQRRQIRGVSWNTDAATLALGLCVATWAGKERWLFSLQVGHMWLCCSPEPQLLSDARHTFNLCNHGKDDFVIPHLLGPQLCAKRPSPQRGEVPVKAHRRPCLQRGSSQTAVWGIPVILPQRSESKTIAIKMLPDFSLSGYWHW